MRMDDFSNQKRVINCIYCLSKLRVPVNRGRISVTCPVCKREFLYHPGSILDTLKQIILPVKYGRFPGNRRNLAILLAAALVILLVLFFALGYERDLDRNPDRQPGPFVHNVELFSKT